MNELRWKAIWSAMEADALDVLVVSGRGLVGQYGDVHWVTGFALFNSVGHGYAVVVRGEPPRLVVGRRDQAIADELGVADMVERVDMVDAPAIGGIGLVEQIAALVGRHGLQRGRVGVTGAALIMPAGDWLALQAALPDAEVTVATRLLTRLKRIKTSVDLEACHEAYALADRGFETFIDVIRPGLTEAEVAAEVERTVRAAGALATLIQVLPGPMWTRPAGPRVLRDNETIACYVETVAPNGCWSEKGDMFALGEPPDRALEVAAAAAEIHARATAMLTPGTLAADIARMVVDEAAAVGCRPGIWSGHGVGVDHDEPLLNGTDETPLEPGMVIALHPHICDDRHGAVTIDQFIVTTGAPERFSRIPRAMRQVRENPLDADAIPR